MVLPADIVEAVVARAPYQPGWNQIRAYLEDAGGDVNDVTANGKTILILFLTTNGMEEEAHSQFVRFLIERGADVNKVDDDGRNALFCACNAGGAFGLAVVRIIIDAGANIDAKTTSAMEEAWIVGETPLSTSIDWMRYGQIDQDRALAYASLLIRRGASIDGCWGGMNAEDCLLHIEDPRLFFDENEYPYQASNPSAANGSSFAALKTIVADERRRKLRELAKAVLTLRTLSLRGRAAPVDPILKFIVNLPDGVAWNLISFWPPRRYPHWVPLRVRSQNSYY